MHGEFLFCTGRVASWYGTLFLCAAIRFFSPFAATLSAGLVLSLPQFSSVGRR